MKIAYYSHYFVPEIGAPSARIYDLAQQWLTEGHQIEVVTCFPNHPAGKLYPGYQLKRYQKETLSRISVHRNWTYITPNEGFIKRTLGHISFWPSTRLNQQQIGPIDIAIGTSPTFFAPLAAINITKRRKIPFVMEVRDLWPALLVELGVLRNRTIIRLLERWELWMYRQATKVVTVTESFRQNLIERGISAEKVHTIPNGADIDFWQPMSAPIELRRKLKLEDCFIVLYIGAHGLSQSLSSILDSAKLLQHHPAIQFLFVGDGAQKEMLVEKATRENISNIRFHDSVGKEQVKEFYALADLCLVPLRDIPLFQTFIPSKMFEIMAMARPIVGSVCGEAAEILKRSGSAAVVAPEDSQAIAATIENLYQNQGQLSLMAQNGHEFVAQHYSRQGLAKTYLKVLGEAIHVY